MLLLGYSGKRNFGDDLLLKQAYDAFVGVADTYIHTSEQHSRYLSAWFPNSKIDFSATIDFTLFKKYTHILHYGGGVFFDYNKTGFIRYLKKRLSLIKNYNLTILQGIHFAGIGIGLGPFIDDNSEKLCFLRLKNFDYLNVRDQKSYTLGRKYNLKNITIGEDLSLANYKYYHSFKLPENNRSSRIIICPRKYPHGKRKNSYLKNLLLASDELISEGHNLFVFGFQSEHDEEVIMAFKERGYETMIWDPEKMSIEIVLKEFANAKLVITARMHGLYLAGILDVPVIGIGVHPKLKLASEIFSKSICLNESFEQNEILEAIDLLKTFPDNNVHLLAEKQMQCENEYFKIKKWLKGESFHI